MERSTVSPAHPTVPANPSSGLPRRGTAEEPVASAVPRSQETATSAPPGASEPPSHERGSLAVAVGPAASERLEAGVRNGPPAPLQQQPMPLVQFPAPQLMPERATTLPPAMEPPLPPRPSPPRLRTAHPASIGDLGSSSEKLVDVDTLSGIDVPELHRDSALRTDQPVPVPPQARLVNSGATSTRRQRDMSYGAGSMVGRGDFRRPTTEWVVPIDEKRKTTVTERLQPTLDVAIAKRDKHAAKAKITGWSLNTAIGLQVLFGSITTGLSALGTTGKSTAVQTTIFGALSTLVASYLAKARGSNEPELSLLRVRDLEQFIREIRAFQLDHGHVDTDEWDKEISHFRQELESILEGERRPATASA